MKNITKKHFKSFLIITFLILGCSLFNVIHPYIVKRILDLDFNSNQILKQIIILAIIYAIVHILRAVFMNLRNIKVNKTIAKILQEIREELFTKVLNLPMKVFDKYSSSEFYTRLTRRC